LLLLFGKFTSLNLKPEPECSLLRLDDAESFDDDDVVVVDADDC